jgi:hypothetical protein
MPLTLNVGISKKHGLPNYGSVGAICNVTVELDAALLTQDLDGFHRHVRTAYAACAQAVNDELDRHKPSTAGVNNGHSNRVSNNEGTNGNGRSSGNPSGNGSCTVTDSDGNGNGGQHRASERQKYYVNQLAQGISGLGVRGLETLVGIVCDKPLADLSSLDASGLIGTLKAIKEGRLSLDGVLNNGAAA